MFTKQASRLFRINCKRDYPGQKRYSVNMDGKTLIYVFVGSSRGMDGKGKGAGRKRKGDNAVGSFARIESGERSPK